jgi:hypothetical protein
MSDDLRSRHIRRSMGHVSILVKKESKKERIVTLHSREGQKRVMRGGITLRGKKGETVSRISTVLSRMNPSRRSSMDVIGTGNYDSHILILRLK